MTSRSPTGPGREPFHFRRGSVMARGPDGGDDARCGDASAHCTSRIPIAQARSQGPEGALASSRGQAADRQPATLSSANRASAGPRRRPRNRANTEIRPNGAAATGHGRLRPVGADGSGDQGSVGSAPARSRDARPGRCCTHGYSPSALRARGPAQPEPEFIASSLDPPHRNAETVDPPHRMTYCSSPITDHRSPITDHRSPITDHRSPTIAKKERST
jgi:hypothetical protein